jgi:hypothetical protein
MDNTLICPAPDADSFTVDGITYTRQDEISVSKAKVLQRLQLELAYDTSLAGIISTADKGWAALNAGRIGDGIYEFGRLRESLNAVGNGEGRRSDINIVGLFYTYPGEPLHYDHALFMEKIRRWEGRVASGFFEVAAFALLTSTSRLYPSAPEAQ